MSPRIPSDAAPPPVILPQVPQPIDPLAPKPGVDPGGPGGVIGLHGPVPDPVRIAAVAIGLSAMLESLSEMMGPDAAANDDGGVALAEAQAKLKSLLGKTSEADIQIQSARRLDALKTKEAKDREAAKKLDEAAAKDSATDIWDKVKAAFSLLAAIFAIAAAVVLIATGGGALAGAALVAVAIVVITGALAGLVGAIDGVVKVSNPDHLGMAGLAAKARGEPLDKCRKDDMICALTLMSVALVGAIATFFLNPGGAASEFAKFATNVGKVGLGLAEAGSGAATIGSAVSTYQATGDRVEAKRIQADSKRLQALISQLDDFIDIAIQTLMGIHKAADAKLDALIEMSRDKANTMSHARIG